MTRTHLASILIAALTGAAAGAVTATWFAPSPGVQTVAAASGDPRIAELTRAQADLQRAIEELRASQAQLAARAERTPATPSALPKEAGDVLPATQTAAAAPAPGEITVEAALAKLCDPSSTWAERSETWEKAVKAGKLDELVDAMKARAEREPNNPQLQVDLGNAYLQEIFASTNQMAKGKWAMRADAAFDAALQLDPQHWEARFTKAMSLSNWPAFTGKPAIAISEFETLVEQQNLGTKKPEHAKTYLYLGNLYQSSGALPKAIETWQKGLDLFPDDAALQAQLASAQHH